MLKRAVLFLLVICLMLPMAACAGGKNPSEAMPVDVEKLFHGLLNQVTYDTVLADVGESGTVFYPALPEYAMVTMYSGSGYHADELTWITLAAPADMEQALESVDTHLEQVHEQFLSYLPDELPKIENAIIWHEGVHIIVCVTNDYATAQALIDDPTKLEEVTSQPVTEVQQTTEAEVMDSITEPPTEAATEEPTEPPTTEPVKNVDTGDTSAWADGTLNAQGYPTLLSVDQSTRDCGAACIVDNMAFEYYGYSRSTAQYYAGLVSKVADALQGQTKVYSLVIPTAIGIVFPDNLVEKYTKSYEKQGERIDEIFSMMSGNVVKVDCYDNMMQHRDEYLYFRTDWHWNGVGAYYAYESFCKMKGVAPYTLDQRRLTKFDGYLGALYQQTCSKDSALSGTPDVVYAYHPHFENAYMYFTDSSGKRYSWNIISDVSNYSADFKYNTFAASDQPFAEFYNPDVTDGSVAIVVKESFGNALMPYVVDHYSEVYEIDYRHWSGDLIEFAKQKGADDIIFANNIGMIRSDYLVGLMDKIIP